RERSANGRPARCSTAARHPRMPVRRWPICKWRSRDHLNAIHEARGRWSEGFFSCSAIMSSLNAREILLGVTGGVAAYKAADLTSRLVQAGAQVSVVLTEAATRFIGMTTFEAL